MRVNSTEPPRTIVFGALNEPGIQLAAAPPALLRFNAARLLRMRSRHAGGEREIRS